MCELNSIFLRDFHPGNHLVKKKSKNGTRKKRKRKKTRKKRKEKKKREEAKTPSLRTEGRCEKLTLLCFQRCIHISFIYPSTVLSREYLKSNNVEQV